MKIANIMQNEDGSLRANRWDLLEALPESKKIDIVHNCHTYSREEMEIVASWEEWFKAKDIPYAVVQKGAKVVIIKERRA